jgi:nitrogen fixation NifU-like protein
MCTNEDFDMDALDDDADDLDRLKVLSGVRQFPMRVKCATLAWHTMSAAITGEHKTSTE